MCGICGIVVKDRTAPVDRRQLDTMTDILAHRGPDGRGTAAFGNVGLGHRHLSILDLEHGRQPMSTPEENLWITFNGELYNYIELRRELVQKGFRLRTYSDTEVLLYLYAAYGLDMFSHMNGMFAFALYDRDKRRLLLARDRFGEKPLYYWSNGDSVLFASEIKALLTHPAVGREADPDAVHEYLTFQYCLEDRTLFRGVRRLRPGHYLVLDEEGREVEHKPYWNLEFEEDHTRDEEHYIDELRFLLEDSVNVRLRSDVPVGAYLSGGLDSTAVSAIASRLLGQGLPVFTGYFAEGDAFNELPWARAAAAHSRNPHHVICPRAEDFASQLRTMTYHLDEPAAGPGAFPQFVVSALARQHVKVVLGGQGGDEVFGGYARYLLMYLEESLKGAIFGSQDPQRHIVTLGRVLPNLGMLEEYVPLLKEFWSKGVFDTPQRRYYSLVARYAALAPALAPGFRDQRNEGAIFAAFETQFNEILGHVSSGGSALLNRMTAYDLRTSLQALLHVEDRMSMAWGLESRLPLLDHRIVELAFRMPPLFKYRDGKAKSALLAAVKNVIPEPVWSRRDKKGFPVPFVEWAQGPLRGMVGDILLGARARQRGIFEAGGVEQLLQEERPFGRSLWGLLSLETWFQTFIDEPPSPSLAADASKLRALGAP